MDSKFYNYDIELKPEDFNQCNNCYGSGIDYAFCCERHPRQEETCYLCKGTGKHRSEKE